jgi:NAD(P)-dependent dehydrogenase (short-subunit alcohol dehydrogenase family)
MLLKDKNPVVYGAGGHIGSAVARAFARDGAKVYLAGRTQPKLEALAEEISVAGGVAEAAQVDALDRRAIEQHLDAIEALYRSLAGELGPQGIRVVCLRPDAIPETWSGEADADNAEVRTYLENGTALGRLPTLDEVAHAAVLTASDRASAKTGPSRTLPAVRSWTRPVS